MTKWDLIDHIAREHPELIYPDRKGLAKWRKDELERTHIEMHNQPGGNQQ